MNYRNRSTRKTAESASQSTVEPPDPDAISRFRPHKIISTVKFLIILPFAGFLLTTATALVLFSKGNPRQVWHSLARACPVLTSIKNMTQSTLRDIKRPVVTSPTSVR